MRLMNSGTKIRTICLILVLLNQANVNMGEVDFGNNTVNLIYRIGSYCLTVIAAIAAWYYNNDTSEEGAIGTGITRQLKRQNDADYIGEVFYMDNIDEEVYEDEDDRELEILDDEEEAGEVDE